jgi:RNA polymerase sigma-70 factor (ECF subfamily)
MSVPPWITRNSSYPTTDWSIVGAAASPNDAAGRAALERLCRRYWYPVYAFIRHRVNDKQQAEELTQSFFGHVLQRGVLVAADPTRGSFRAYLLRVCRNFLTDEWRRRRHEVLTDPVVSRDALRDAAGRFAQEPPAPDPEAGFDLDWALQVLTNALEAVRSRYAARHEAERFDRLRANLPLQDGELPGPQAEAAAALGLSVGAYKKALHDLRAAFNRQVRHEMAQTLSDPAAVEEEIRNLLANARRIPPARDGHAASEACQ